MELIKYKGFLYSFQYFGYTKKGTMFLINVFKLSDCGQYYLKLNHKITRKTDKYDNIRLYTSSNINIDIRHLIDTKLILLLV